MRERKEQMEGKVSEVLRERGSKERRERKGKVREGGRKEGRDGRESELAIE